MRIVPFPNFQHAASLKGFSAARDPRGSIFAEARVDIDLRGCEFIRPPAALWCLIYALLASARGSVCSVLVPEAMPVCIYLKSIGLFRVLNENGVNVDERGIPDRDAPQLILPLTRIENVSQVDDLTNRAYEVLSGSSLGAANLYGIISETFAELAQNAVQHADSPIAAYGLIQFYESELGQRFVCVVADGGVGIRRSLEKNPELADRVPYDWVAIELAVRERISGTTEKTRGIGLFGIAEDMRMAGRQLIIHSGQGSLRISEDMQSEARRTKLFPGTLAYASIPT